MKTLHILSSEVILSIQRFSILKITDLKIEHNDIQPFLSNYYDTLQPLYTEWIRFVSVYEEDTWKRIKPFKNNLNFIFSTFEQFKTEVKNQIIKLSHVQMKRDTVSAPVQNEYYQYANDLSIEAYGLPLEKKEYSKKELLNIIKNCELEIVKGKHSKHKNHKVISIFS